MGVAVHRRVRRDDGRQYRKLTERRGLQSVTLTDAEKREWISVMRQARTMSTGLRYPRALIERVERCARSNGKSCN